MDTFVIFGIPRRNVTGSDVNFEKGREILSLGPAKYMRVVDTHM